MHTATRSMGRASRILVQALKVLLAFAAALEPMTLMAGSKAEPTLPVGPDRRVQVYRLEAVELRGSTRMTADQLASELGLIRGAPLGQELVMETRARLLSLGLFKSAILVMRKGSRPGLARLIVEVEDDDLVLTDWALGGDLGVTIEESGVNAANTATSPMDYRLSLVGRNLFNAMHRGAAMIDVDSTGNVRASQVAYGLPRFTREDVQFDAELALVDPRYRYLDTLGFGAHGQGLWSKSIAGVGNLAYGAAMYVNKSPRFALPGFPQGIAGPTIALYKETRLKGFIPGPGYLLAPSLVLSPTETHLSLLKLEAAHTLALGELAALTFQAQALSVGTTGFSLRGESRLDVALGHARPGEDQAEAFVRLRGGRDVRQQTGLSGAAALVGLRYHSSGFIAELALQVTRAPASLAPNPITPTPTPLVPLSMTQGSQP